MKKFLIHLLSWMIVLGILVTLLHGMIPEDDPRPFGEKIAAAVEMLRMVFRKAHWGWVLGLLINYLFYITWAECLGIAWVMRRFHQPVTILEMVPARVVTFLIAVFNYQAGQAGLLFYLKRIHGIPIRESTSSIFFLALMDFFIILLLGATGALFLSEKDLQREILVVAVIGLALYLVHALLWRLAGQLRWLKDNVIKRVFFQTFQRATLRDYLMLFWRRLPIHLGLIVAFSLLFRFFHVPMPMLKMVVYIPLVMIVSNIPLLNVGMVGASQAALIYFFRNDAPEDTLLALSLAWAIGLNILKVIAGGLMMTRYSKALFYPPS